ncbi:MAG TPA: DNA polymerase [Candidatus Saccharimonadales bacterium]|jgi:hypothetical protein
MIEARITSSYEHKLQAIYYDIANRGIRIDMAKIKTARSFVKSELLRNMGIAANQWNIKLFIGAGNNPNLGLKKDDPNLVDAYNLNSTSGEKSLLKMLQRLGYTVPKISKRNQEGEYESKYSTNELALQRILRDNQFNYPSGDPAIQAILAIRELSKLDSSYLGARFYRTASGDVFYLSSYNVAGTLTGRRASRKHTFSYGNNAQNFPKHGAVAKLFRESLIARPGRIFLMVDQKSAEEWPVSALALNHEAISDMMNGVNRHIKRAVFIFNIPESSRTETQWKDSMEYYLGKKTGHANNYGMKQNTMAESLIREGYWIPVNTCGAMLLALNKLEPNTHGVFHKYIEDTVYDTRMLVTPFHRERQFLGLRPNDNNVKILNEAYSWIPQSVVGDNTGFAVAHLGSEFCQSSFIVQEGHDSIVNDIRDTPDDLWNCLCATVAGFDRRIVFHNGIDVQIPIEAELGYDFATTVKVKDLSYDGLVAARAQLLAMIGQKDARTAPAVA